MAASAVAKGLMDKKSKDKAGKSAQEADINAAKLKQAVSEDARLARAGMGASMAPELIGKGFTMPGADFLSQLKVRRNYDPMIEKSSANPAAGSGSAFLSGLFGTAGNVASQYYANQQDDGGGRASNPLEDTGITVGTPEDPALNPGLSSSPGYSPFNTNLGGSPKPYNPFDPNFKREF